MPITISLDLESFSEADLKAVGAYKYAAHPSTDVLLTSGIVKGESHLLWGFVPCR